MSQSNFTTLLERNAEFAATDAKENVPKIPFIPFKQTYVITCMDPRVEPGAILGVQLGEAIVARNVGGRVTPAVIKDLAWILHLHENLTPDAEWFEIAVIHHTDCGMLTFTDDAFKRSIQDDTGIKPAWGAEAFPDLDEDVRQSIARIKASPFVPHTDAIRGFVFDVPTGRLNEVK